MATPKPKSPHVLRSDHDHNTAVSVGNVVSGTVAANVVQAGVVQGNVHIHQPQPSISLLSRQLPAARELFVGRDDQLAELDHLLSLQGATSASAVVISAIGGTGGIGKTWLALAWAHRHLDRFPDGQLFVDLCGFSPTNKPMVPGDALWRFLSAMGIDHTRIPSEVDMRAALYRSVVAGKRMLVVLDNAASAEQVIPLLPGSASCTVLVTSRNRLRGLATQYGARTLPLGVLGDAEARALLVAALSPDRVAAEENAVAELIALCDGFPLALGLIAARARTQPRLPLRDTVAELRDLGLNALDADDPTASLPAVLSWSLHTLTDEQRLMFPLLGIAPGPDISLPAAASLVGLPMNRARVVLSSLEDACLLDRGPGGRYVMHDLVRAYASALAINLPRPVRQDALDRVVDFYLHTADTAHSLLDPHAVAIPLSPPTSGTSLHPLIGQPAAMAWLNGEHPHLVAAQQAAVVRHRHHVVWHLAWALTTFHRRQGRRHDDLAMWQVALDATAYLPDPTARTNAHRNLGRAYGRLGWHGKAIEHLSTALALAEQHHNIIYQAHTHNEFAAAWGRRGDNHKALEHAQCALDLYCSLDNSVWKASALSTVGWYTARLGYHDAARECCQTALTLHRRHRNPNGEAASLDCLGWIDQHTGYHHQAIRQYHEALTLNRSLGNTYRIASTLDRLGFPHLSLGQHQHAREAWREALFSCTANKDVTLTLDSFSSTSKTSMKLRMRILDRTSRHCVIRLADQVLQRRRLT